MTDMSRGTFVAVKDDPTKMTRFVVVPLDKDNNTYIVSTSTTKAKIEKFGMISCGVANVKTAIYDELVAQLPEHLGTIYRTIEKLTTIDDAPKHLEQIGVIIAESGDDGQMVFILMKIDAPLVSRDPRRRIIVKRPLADLLRIYRIEDTKLRRGRYRTNLLADLLNFGRVLNEAAKCEFGIVECIKYIAFNNMVRTITYGASGAVLAEHGIVFCPTEH